MATLSLLDLRPLLHGGWQDLLPLLPPERQERIRSCPRDADQARLTGAGWLLRLVLERAGVPPEQQRFSAAPLGKPQLAGHPELQFSLSHSGRWAVCALAGTPVGVDVEGPRCTPAIARRFFHPDELPDFDSMSEPEYLDRLNRLWTAKEAFTKALGGGLTIPLDRFLVHLPPDGARLEQTLSPLPYRLHEYRLADCRLCLCTVDDRPEPELISLGL